MHDKAFAGYVADRLAVLPGVVAVSLGGSRAQGTHQPDSDWDFAIYYRARFDPEELRDIGWPGEVFEVGGWGGGVFNGGAWLTVDERETDVHYRDVDSVEHEIAESAEGRFRIEPLMFHLVGIPSYLVVAERPARLGVVIERVERGHAIDRVVGDRQPGAVGPDLGVWCQRQHGRRWPGNGRGRSRNPKAEPSSVVVVLAPVPLCSLAA